MNLSIAGAYAERRWIQAMLLNKGIKQPEFRVLADWLSSDDEDANLTDVERTYWSRQCCTEIDQSHVLVYFQSNLPGFGRHREIGYAIGRSKVVLMVGDRSDHPHDHHPSIHICAIDELPDKLRRMEPFICR